MAKKKTQVKLPPSTGKKKTDSKIRGKDGPVVDSRQDGSLPIDDVQSGEQDVQSGEQSPELKQGESLFVGSNEIVEAKSLSRLPNFPKTVKTVALTVPLYHESIGTPRRRVDTKSLTMEQRQNLQRLKNGLDKLGTKLKDGTSIRTEASAIKWMLEQLSEDRSGDGD